MSEIVISVENLSKRYQLGNIGTGTLSRDINQWFARIRGKEDPYSTLDSIDSRAGHKNDFWALQDISFEVRQGDTVGIIGKNGAGKSTLLKILSRITKPTSGLIKVDGRIASLLEVGTGFHPDLTGRENIFLNGAILGMTKLEIRKKLDEIIAFSGVERHIDTPVKRYSSGMHVRLAFAVAAHLEPEILIVDEVLAVGDAEFQKKCLGKMKDVAGEGRTILFVSHNMAAVKKLCSRGIYFQSGKLCVSGTVDEAVEKYLSASLSDTSCEITWKPSSNTRTDVQIVALRALDKNGTVCNAFYIDEDFFVEVEFITQKDGKFLSSYFEVRSSAEVEVFSSANWSSATLNRDPFSSQPYEKGRYKSRMKVPGRLLNDGVYLIDTWILENVSSVAAEVNEQLTITVVDTGEMRKEYTGEWFGVVRPRLEWSTENITQEVSWSVVKRRSLLS